MKNLRLLLLFPALCAPFAAFAQFVPQDYVPMRFIQSVSPVFPERVIAFGLTSGEARVAVQVDDSGQLTDFLVVAYSHPAFAEAATSAVKKWHFRPAMVHGFPRSATAVLDFKFKAGRVVVDLSTDSAAEMIHFQAGAPTAAASLPVSARSDQGLDRIPTPTKISQAELQSAEKKARRSHVQGTWDDGGVLHRRDGTRTPSRR